MILWINNEYKSTLKIKMIVYNIKITNTLM